MGKNDKKNKVIIIFVSFVLLFGIIFYLRFFGRQKRRPNVIIITMDALRADHLGCYGYRRNTSPNIDKIAREGVLFLNAIAQGSFTPPSLPSILTSNYPPIHGVFDFGDKISEKLVTLPYLLRTRGYQTGFFSSHPSIGAIRGFEKDFDTFFTTWTFKYDNNTERYIKSVRINERVISWIKEHKNKEFFLWIHYFEPHSPLRPLAAYKKMFFNDHLSKTKIEVPISKNETGGFGGIPKALAAANNYITDLSYYISLYDGAIRYVDEQVGELLRNLKEMDLDKHTLIIFSTDHGEGLGEHNLYFTHGFQLYDELIKVPLIIRFQGRIAKGKKIVTQVQHIDIAPTILDILGRKKPPAMAGRSLISLIEGRDGYNVKYGFSFIQGKSAVRTQNRKLIYNNDDDFELYNLRKDPQELDNIAAKETFEILKQELSVYLDMLKPPAREGESELDKETKRQLKSLGYLQ